MDFNPMQTIIQPLAQIAREPRRLLNWSHWLRGLWTACLQGGCSAAVGTLGIAGGEAIGLNVQMLGYKQMGAVFLGAFVVHGLIFLKANPFPEEIKPVTKPPFPAA